jgi:hypothetical protein
MILRREKLIRNRHWNGRPVLDVKRGKVKSVGESEHHPYRCDMPAKKLRVSQCIIHSFYTAVRFAPKGGRATRIQVRSSVGVT